MVHWFRCIPAMMLVLACAPAPLPAPAPVSITSARSKAGIVEAARRELTSAGFEIASVDSAAGSLTAKRTRERRGNFDYITCKFAENSLAETQLVSTVTVNVSTASSTDVNRVEIGASVLATYPGLEDSPLPRADSQTDCVSTGAIEKQLATAIAR